MSNFEIYNDIAKRTGGDIYVGVVGPVRTGKSTFISKFMQSSILNNIKNEYEKQNAGQTQNPYAGRDDSYEGEPQMGGNSCTECCMHCYTCLCVECLFYTCCGCR